MTHILRLPLWLLVCACAATPAFAQKPGAGAKPAKSAPVLPGGNSKDPISIDAGKLEYFDKEQKAVYSGNVVVIQGESTLKCSVLVIFLAKSASAAPSAPPSADQPGKPAAAPSPGGGSEVRRMEAAGPVTVVQKDQVGTGDSGIYDKTENKVYLIGHVTLSQGPNVTKGEKLTYDMDKGTALVESSDREPRVKGLFIPGSGSNDPNAPAKKPKSDAKPAPKP